MFWKTSNLQHRQSYEGKELDYFNCGRQRAHSFYWASGWAGCWKAGHSIAVSRLHNVPLKCVQACNRGWIRVPEPESRRDSSDSAAGAVIPFSNAKVILSGWRKNPQLWLAGLGEKVQTFEGGGGDVAKRARDEVKNMPGCQFVKQTYTAWKHTRVFFFRHKEFSRYIPVYRYMPKTPPFRAVSTHISCLFLVAAGTGRWDGAVQSLHSSKRLPLVSETRKRSNSSGSNPRTLVCLCSI